MIDDILEVIRSGHGLTATEIANRLFGINGYGERVGGVCRVLAQFGHVERRGKGGPGDPFTYHPNEAIESIPRSGGAGGGAHLSTAVGREYGRTT